MYKVAELSDKEFAEALKKTTSLVIPFGTVEAHSNHLPLSTDSIIPEGICSMLMERRKCLIGESLNYGVVRSTKCHPGTVGISFNTLLLITREIIEGYYLQGVRQMVLLTGHGGSTHTPALIIAADEMSDKYSDLQIAVAEAHDINRSQIAQCIETEGDGHAGEYETSLLQFFAPSLYKGFGVPSCPLGERHIIPKDRLAAWPIPVNGDPTKASPEKGAAIAEIIVQGIDSLLSKLEDSNE